MKSNFFILLGVLLLLNPVFAQDNDSIFIFGCEDNSDNIEKYRKIIVTKIDSIMSNETSSIKSITGKFTLCYTIDELGNVKNIYFKENKGFSYKTDSIIFDTLKKLKFMDAAVFNPCSQKRYSINFTLPIIINHKE